MSYHKLCCILCVSLKTTLDSHTDLQPSYALFLLKSYVFPVFGGMDHKNTVIWTASMGRLLQDLWRMKLRLQTMKMSL